ncbi:MAG TPA: alpha-ketoglutarate-dependent dioxygenase AlkB [Magnetospirillum sp.]|nr:alpha-ketoglutarate-dependent dioxygenase AlkB [Magnetospirillum sp.]
MIANLFPPDAPEAPPSIAGLGWFDEWICETEETQLLGTVDAGAWRDDLKRRVQHFGYRYDYRARLASPEDRLGPLPQWLASLAERLARAGVFRRLPDQVIVNEYLPGQGISAHIDCVPCFGETIAILSLGGTVIMTLRHPASGRSHDIVLPRRSLLILSGPARYEWQHAIPARKSDVVSGCRIPRVRRVSLTFRTMVI